MPVPENHTEETLAQYMMNVLDKSAAPLGIEQADVAKLINDILVAYGVEDIADATEVPKLQAIARYKVLQYGLLVASTPGKPGDQMPLAARKVAREGFLDMLKTASIDLMSYSIFPWQMTIMTYTTDIETDEFGRV